MGWGVCLGGIGIGSCSGSSSTASQTIANQVIAESIRSNLFKCTQKTDAGQRVTARGCSCQEIGLPTLQCQQHLSQISEDRQALCAALAKSIGKDITAEQYICFCTPGGSCNMNVEQTSSIFLETKCSSISTAKQNIQSKLSDSIAQKMKEAASDFGALLDTSDQSVISNASNMIKTSLDDETIKKIQSVITNPQVVEASCGGINIGITQHSQLNAILNVISNDKLVQQARNDLQSVVQQKVSRKNNGFTGWLTGSIGTIVLIIVGLIILAIVLYVLFKSMNGGGGSKTVVAAAPAPAKTKRK
jgi:hypothetical protein